MELSATKYPVQTSAVLGVLEATGNAIDATVTYVDDVTGNEVSRHWNEIPEHTRNQLKGTIKIVSIFVPAGSIKALKMLKTERNQPYIPATNSGSINLSDGFSSFSAFKRQYGPAGEGQAWHHLVEQGPNAGRFAAEAIHNPANLIKLPHGTGTIHNQISGFYSSKQPFTGGQTVRNWLSTKPYQEQFDFGVQTIKDFGGSQYLPTHLR